MQRGTPLPVPIAIAALTIGLSLVIALNVTKRSAMATVAAGIVLLIGLALYNARLDAAKPVATASAILAGILGIVVLLIGTNILQHAVPLCGDGVCTTGECQEGCSDCTPDDCRDGTCQLPIERCDTSPDCFCPTATVCVPGRPKADLYGCASVVCGDGACDRPEGPQDCCKDCGCMANYACQNNICFFQPPAVTFTPLGLKTDIGVTYLAANHRLTNASGTPHPLAAIILRNSISTADKVTVRFSIPDLAEGSVYLGALAPGAEQTVPWFLEHEPRLLTVVDDMLTNITVEIAYTDLENVTRTIRRSYPILLRGRGYLEDESLLPLYVTPEDIAVKGKTPEDIWNELRPGIRLIPETGLVQFPAETMAYGRGSQRDIAVLMVSAYQSADLDPGFLLTEKGVFVWVRTVDDFIVVDPSRASFTEAQVSKIGTIREIVTVESVWTDRRIRPLSMDARHIPGAAVSVQMQASQDCTSTVASYVIRNTGLVRSDVCIRSELAAEAPESRSWCARILPGSSERIEHAWRLPSCQQPGVTARIETESWCELRMIESGKTRVLACDGNQ